MKKSSFLLLIVLASPFSADFIAAGRVDLTSSFKNDDALALCWVYEYRRETCGNVPLACGLCDSGDSRGECKAKVSAAPREIVRAKLPTVTRRDFGHQVGICDSEDPHAACLRKISRHYGRRGLDGDHCSVVDPENIGQDEWEKCEDAAAAVGLAPWRRLDDLPHYLGCLELIDLRSAERLRSDVRAGRRKMPAETLPAADTSDDEL